MVMETGTGSRAGQLSPVISREDFLAMQEQIHSVYLKQEVAEYLLRRSVRPAAARCGFRRNARRGPGENGKGIRMVSGQGLCSPQDVGVRFPFVVRHRLILSLEARRKQAGADAVVEEIREKNQASASRGSAPIYKIFRRRFCINML